MFLHVIKLLTSSPKVFRCNSFMTFVIVSTFVNLQFRLRGCIGLYTHWGYILYPLGYIKVLKYHYCKLSVNWLTLISHECIGSILINIGQTLIVYIQIKRNGNARPIILTHSIERKLLCLTSKDMINIIMAK